jgi:hypothetical protein
MVFAAGVFVTVVAYAAPATPRAPVPFASFRPGRAVVEFDRKGGLVLKRGGEVLVSGADLVIARPGWAGTASQSGARAVKGWPRRGRGSVEWRSEASEPGNKVRWRITETVREESGALRFRYEAVPDADTECSEASLFLDLPLAAWSGKPGVLWPTAGFTFPPQRPARRHFASATARKLALGPDGGRTTFRFATPAAVTVQDCRELGSTRYQAYARLHGGGRIAKGTVVALEFVLVPDDGEVVKMADEDYGMAEKAGVRAVNLPSGTAFTCERFEIALDVAGTWETPFDPDQVKVDGVFLMPSGKKSVVPAFFTEDYGATVAEAAVLWESRGTRGWRIRFAPVEEGEHQLVVTVRDRTGAEARSGPSWFTAKHSGKRGYIRVSGRDKRYLEYDDGTPYFAVGMDVPGIGSPVTAYERIFPKMGKAGANFARIWLSSFSMGFEWGKPGRYRMRSAAETDRVLELAEANGISLMFCLEAWRQFEGNDTVYRPDDIHPYWARNGGPCSTEMDFFTNPEAKRMWRNRLRYAVARWGYSPSVIAWEFWNEVNCVKGYRERSRDMVAWTGEMGRYLKETDPWKHLATNSLGSYLDDPALWKLPEMDIVQGHGYWHPTEPDAKEAAKDMAAFIASWQEKLNRYGKPAIYSEFGLVNESWGRSPLMEKDAGGEHFHEGLWAPVFHGGAGTAMLWWPEWVDSRDLYVRFLSVTRFLANVPWTRAGFGKAAATSSDPAAKVSALVGRHAGSGFALVQVRNAGHTWWNAVNGVPMPSVEKAVITVPGMPDGRYILERWDAWECASAGGEYVRAERGRVSFEVTGLERDIAVMIRPE